MHVRGVFNVFQPLRNNDTMTPTTGGENHESSSTLQLLAQYNDHTLERDKLLEPFEKRNDPADQPSYDELFKENVKLKLQVHEYKIEIQSLTNMIEILKANRVSGIDLKQDEQQPDDDQGQKHTLVLPPRSADRRKNLKNLTLNASAAPSVSSLPRSPSSFSLDKKAGITPVTQQQPAEIVVSKSSPNNTYASMPPPSDLAIIKSASTASAQVSASPATSVTYTTSRISIVSPTNAKKKSTQQRSASSSPGSDMLRSPQRANRVTALINNQLHSPLKQIFDNASGEGSPSKIYPKSPLPDLMSQTENGMEFSPTYNQNLNSFTEMLDNSFGDEEDSSPAPPSVPPSVPSSAPPSVLTSIPPSIPFSEPPKPELLQATTPSLASPVLLSKPNNTFRLPSHTSSQQIKNTDVLEKHDLLSKESSSYLSPASVSASGLQTPFSPQSSYNGSIRPLPSSQHPQQQRKATETLAKDVSSTASHTSSPTTSIKTPFSPHFSQGSTNKPLARNNSMNTQSTARSIRSDIPLFIQPEEFSTIRMEIASTLYSDMENSRSDDSGVLFSIIDRNSGKEIFKFSKTIEKIYELDTCLKPCIDSLSLPPLPERQLFNTNVPAKVDYRRERLNDYFTTLFLIPELPPNVGLRIAQFMSTDTVTIPVVGIGESLKEGVLLMRKNKTLGSGGNWRVRYGVVDGPTLQLLDQGQISESIKLLQSSMELQANLPDDRYGTKNGFIINEHKKSGLSSTTRYYFCAETSKERESWVSVLSEFVENPLFATTNNKSENSSIVDHNSGDTAVELGYGGIGPMVNLQQYQHSSALPSPSQTSDATPSEDDKEIRRNRMRSFFPFKKLNITSTSSVTHEGGLMSSPEGETETENSFAKSLQSMNLSSKTNVVFGSDLKNCLSLSSHTYQGFHQIPSIVYRCLEYLYRNHGIEEEGIFRLSGSSALIKSLQEQFDEEYDVDLCDYNNNIAPEDLENHAGGRGGIYVDVNTVTGLLKLYLRKLPHLIFGDQMFSEFKAVVENNAKDEGEIALSFRELVLSGSIPQENISLMYVLFELLLKISQKSSVNKMNLRNLCIVFSPTLNISVNILQPFIVDFECIFQGKQPVENSVREKLDIHIPQM